MGVALLHLLLGWVLLLGFAPAATRDKVASIAVFDVRALTPPPPLPPEEPVVVREPPAGPAPREPEGAAAPPAPRAQPKPLAAPEPTVPVQTDNPAAAAGLIPVSGDQAGPFGGAGAGNGSGSGGTGKGSGSGTSGSGTGGGGSGGSGAAVVRAQHRGGRIVPADYPRAAQGRQGLVEAQLTVGTDGRVTGCRVARSSGSAVLDETTCRLIRERFRFAPARDAQGNAVADIRGWQQRWWQD